MSSRRRRDKILELLRKPMPTCSPFDAKGTIVYGLRSLRERICNDRSPCCSLVTLYAKMGLHRYNLLKETIKDQGGLYQGGLCSRPGNIPESPTENLFENGKRFYVLNNNSEGHDNDWIRLYLELAVAKCRITTENPDVSNLKIKNVAIETQDLNEGLNAKNATVYITYKDFCEARVGKDVHRIAIVRRTFSKRTRCFSLTLMGQHHSSEIIPKKGVNQSEDDSCEAGAGKDADRIKSSFNYEHASCLNPKGQDLSTEKKVQVSASYPAFRRPQTMAVFES